MSKPRVFVSSTYYDLKHIRAATEGFIKSLGFEPILFERGNIAYSSDIRPVDSAYRDASLSDIFVLIIGGKYGSIDDPENLKIKNLPSITTKEFRSAVEMGVPIYILIETAVLTEYQTYKRNKGANLDWAQVESVRVFHLIEEVLSQKLNNPVQPFEKFGDIESWLREQWAGRFGQLLAASRGQRDLDLISEQIDFLKESNLTLRKYVESLMKNDLHDEKEALIKDETERLKQSEQARQNAFIRFLMSDEINMSFDSARELLVDAQNFPHLLELVKVTLKDEEKTARVKKAIREVPVARTHINELRIIYNYPPLTVPEGWNTTGIPDKKF